MNNVPDAILNERAQHFLKVLIERYIRDGQPVGSRTLAKDTGLDLSPATIRNVMADLEELGFVTSPHTSAGRVPTVSGYRLFVDSLISLRPMALNDLDRARSQLAGEDTPHHLVESASRLLSGLTHMAGVVMIPRHHEVRIKEVQFIPLSPSRVLSILVTSQGEVMNQVIEPGKAYSRSDLEQASNFINRHYSGMALDSMRARIVREMNQDRRDMDDLMKEALSMADMALSASDDEDIVVSGQTNLMDFDELANMGRLRKLFDAFSEKQEILHLLDRCSQTDGVQIFIGEESGYGPLEQCSVITAPYEADGKVVGVLGVVGPTRMAYDRVIPIVDVTAKLLGMALKSR